MKLWLLLAIASAVCSGVSGFTQKIAVEQKTDPLFLILAQAITMISASWVYLLYKWESLLVLWEWSIWLTALVAILACAQFFVIRVRAEVLKYLSSSEYFISFRILSVVLLTWVWLVLFGEVLSQSQIFWLVIGFLGILLLFEEDKRLQHSRNWSRAISLLMLSIWLGSIVQLCAKYLALESSQIAALILYQWTFLFLLAALFYQKKFLKLFYTTHPKKDLIIASAFWLTICLAAITNFMAFYYSWPIGIVAKVLGYSVFIPIILSMIFYREKLSIKKWIAFILTIISIYYLN